MRRGYETAIAPCNILHGQGSQATNAEVFTDKRADDIAMYHGALDLFNIVAIVPLQPDVR